MVAMLISGCTSKPKPIHWNETVDADLRYAVQEYLYEIPVMDGEIIKSMHGYDEASKTKYANVAIETSISPNTANIAYKTLLLENNYTVDANADGSHLAVKDVSIEYKLVLFYEATTSGGKNIFSLQTYLYQDKITTWPGDDIKEVLGSDIPHYKAPYYYIESGINYGTLMFQLLCFGITPSSENEYVSILKKAGWITRKYNGLNNAVLEKTGANLDFYYDEEYEALLIQGYLLPNKPSWPGDAIKNKFGFTLPKYDSDEVTYYGGYQYLSETQKYYCVEVEYVDKNCIKTYTNQLLKQGWLQEGEDEPLPDDWPFFLGESERFKSKNNEHSVEIRFYDPDNPLLYMNGYDIPYPIMLIVIYY